MKFAQRIKELRTEKEMTQKQLALELGCTQPMIVLWEKGECEPTESVIKKAAIFFQVTADYLIGLEDEVGARINNTYNNNGTHIGDIKF